MESTDFYYEEQNESSKLIYTIGILWNQINSKLNEVLLKVNLNISKFNILMIIKHVGQKNGIQQNEISKKLLVTASNITKLLDKLENDGLIIRNDKAGDRRVKIIKITQKGSNLLDEIWGDYTEVINKISLQIPKGRQQTLLNDLLLWNKNISKCNN